jgi:glycine/D-amino acid oxidase-like deaminating enzyme
LTGGFLYQFILLDFFGNRSERFYFMSIIFEKRLLIIKFGYFMRLKSNEPFWLVKNGLKHTYPSLREDIETEILIVGSGITGSLIAHRCIAEGHQCVLVDRREVVNGSSSATTSMLQYEIDVPLGELIEMIGEEGAVASYKACFDAIDTLGALAEKIKSGCGFKKKESLYYAAYKKDVEKLYREFEVRQKHGFPVRWIEAHEIERKYGLKATHGGILSQQGASIDAFLLAHDLLYYNYNKGLQVFDKTNIEDVVYKRNGVVATTEHGNKIKAKQIIYCTGFESVEVVKDNFVNLISTYAIVGEVDETDCTPFKNTLVWNTASPYIYMRTTKDNRLLIGGEDEEFVSAKRRDALLNRKSKKLEKVLKRIYPNTNFRTDFVWAGTFGETKDGLPYIGTHPEFPSAYFVLGFGGNGITFSVIGMDMVDAHLKGKPHPLDSYFKFRR